MRNLAKISHEVQAAVCDCGTPWTFLLPFFFFFSSEKTFKDYMILNRQYSHGTRAYKSQGKTF